MSLGTAYHRYANAFSSAEIALSLRDEAIPSDWESGTELMKRRTEPTVESDRGYLLPKAPVTSSVQSSSPTFGARPIPG